VDRLRQGRVFVAGDVAHIYSPAAPQDMNTGIQEAVNLAWKIALVLRGEAEDRLLDTYDEERRPIEGRVLTTTDVVINILAAPTDRLVSCAITRRRMSLTDHWKVVCDRENAPPISLHRLAVGGIFLVCFRITDIASLGENDKGEVFARYQWHYLCSFYL